MLSGVLRRKTDRAVEIATLALRHTRDARSKAALLSCYAGILHDVNDRAEVLLRLTSGATTIPVHMRKSDVFTLAEIFRERQYAIATPLPPRPLIIDGGANIGLSAIWFLGQYPGAHVHCFEPEPENLRLLEANLGGRADVTIHRAAIGKSAGRLRLHLSTSGAMHSVKDAAAGDRSIDVDVVSLADYLRARNIAHVDLVKLDVEGSELDALEGLGGRLNDVGVIAGEFHETLVDEGRFYRLLEDHGFRVVRRERTHEDGVHVFEAARR